MPVCSWSKRTPPELINQPEVQNQEVSLLLREGLVYVWLTL